MWNTDTPRLIPTTVKNQEKLDEATKPTKGYA